MYKYVLQQDELSEEEFSEENSNESDSSGEDLETEICFMIAKIRLVVVVFTSTFIFSLALLYNKKMWDFAVFPFNCD